MRLNAGEDLLHFYLVIYLFVLKINIPLLCVCPLTANTIDGGWCAFETCTVAVPLLDPELVSEIGHQ